MPHPEQTRQGRIEALLKECNDKKIDGFLSIKRKAFVMYPYVGEGTAMSYAKAVYRLLKAAHITEKEEKTE